MPKYLLGKITHLPMVKSLKSLIHYFIFRNHLLKKKLILLQSSMYYRSLTLEVVY